VSTANPYQLTVTMPSDREISMSRSFDAPRDLVFSAFIDPALIPRWWGQGKSSTVIDKLDARPGGAWRFVEHAADGNEYAFRGEFRDITPPERIEWTFEFEGMPGNVLTETMIFTEADGVTTITSTSLFDTTEQRDGMLNSGMESGAAESYNRLAELLKTLR
jgi:uncharacterized protein YndB with AHSA1/START domain